MPGVGAFGLMYSEPLAAAFFTFPRSLCGLRIQHISAKLEEVPENYRETKAADGRRLYPHAHKLGSGISGPRLKQAAFKEKSRCKEGA